MVPIDQGGRYGYAVSAAAADSFHVEYVTPVLQTSVRDTAREQDIEQEKSRAYDLALWRAAQIAQERGYEAFIVEESSRDADVSIDSGNYYAGRYASSWYNHFGYAYGPYPYRRFGYVPYYPYPYNPHAFGYYDRPRASMQVHVRLTVREASPDEVGAFDTTATASRLAAAYANATWPSQ
jgi:hypothetical protein